MAKGKHKKVLKSEKNKVKLKAKGNLPKNLNVTNASFKTKRIVIREQHQKGDLQFVECKTPVIKDHLTRLQHYNSSIRLSGLRDLKDILSRHSVHNLNTQMIPLLNGISALVLDKEKDVRRESIKVLNLILSPSSKEQLLPFCDILMSYLSCAMSHINPSIMEDSLLFLDLLLQTNSTLLIQHYQKILTNFVNMISKLCTNHAQPERQLTMSLSSKNTSVKWRIKVLTTLQTVLISMVQSKKREIQIVPKASKEMKVKNIDQCPIFLPNSLQVCSIDFGVTDSQSDISEKYINLNEFKNYINTLIPLLLDCWLEVSTIKNASDSGVILSNEAATLLTTVSGIIQAIMDYIDLLDSDSVSTCSTSIWFKDTFQNKIYKSLFTNFPYVTQSHDRQKRKRQEDVDNDFVDKCYKQNFTLSYICVWFITIENVMKNNSDEKTNSRIQEKIFEYINDNLAHLASSESMELLQHMRVFRILFSRSSTLKYKHRLPLLQVLGSLVGLYLSQPKKELQIHLFSILSDIVTNHNLEELHNNDTLKKFVESLPALLLRKSINDNVIRLLNRVVLQYKQWVQNKLQDKFDAIIENAKTIEIVGAEDQQQSRLMICNLLYSANKQVYY